MRNDSMLYSGLTAPIRRERVEKEQQESKPDAKAEMVLEEIARLKLEAMDIRNIVTDESIADDVKLRKLERMRERFNDLHVLERRMQKLLGVKVSKERP